MNSTGWSSSKLYFDGDSYFSDLLQEFNQASESIWLELYIFELDRLGDRVLCALELAASRGLKVRILLDAFGSINSITAIRTRIKNSNIDLAVFHPLPWNKTGSWTRLFKRTHRKIFLIDSKIAFLGGINVNEAELTEFSGEQAWLDAGVRLEGQAIKQIQDSMQLVWPRKEALAKKIYFRFLMRQSFSSGPDILINITRKLRRLRNKLIYKKIRQAEARVLITTAYFVPNKEILSAFKTAAAKKIDVRILLPTWTDVPFMPWAAHAFYGPLLKAGIRVFEYTPRMLHSKTIVIDDWATVGSSNFNHRSLQHDLEIDAVLTSSANIKQLADRFEIDLGCAKEILLENLGARPWWQRLIGRLVLLVKNQL